MDLNSITLDMLCTLWKGSMQNQKLHNEIEVELAIRIANNDRFSREYIYQNNVVLNKALGIEFIPTSDAFNSHGHNVTLVTLELNNLEKNEMISNITNTHPVNTKGILNGRILKDDHEILIWFNTSDILVINLRT